MQNEDITMQGKMEQKNQELESKRKELSELAQKLYEETGSLADPLLCEISNEYTDLAVEYLGLLKQQKNLEEK